MKPQKPIFKPVEINPLLGNGHSFLESVVSLIFHIIGSAVLFLVFATVSWLLGYVVHSLGLVHPFDGAVLNVLHAVELWLLYIDIFLSGMVLLVGAFRFLLEIGGRK